MEKITVTITPPDKIYQLIDSNGFFISPTVYSGENSIDTEEPIYNAQTEKARWVEDNWVIKTKQEWEEIMKPEEIGEEV